MSGAVRAGQAFVELVVKDDAVAASLENMKQKLRAFGASIETASRQTMRSFNESATPSIVASSAAIASSIAPLTLLGSAAVDAGSVVRSVFSSIAKSVGSATISILGAAETFRGVFKGTRFEKLLSPLLDNARVLERAGTWTHFWGRMFNSPTLKNAGNQIQRLGLGASIAKGFGSDIFTGLGEAGLAGLRSMRTVANRTIRSIFLGPFVSAARGARAVLGSLSGSGSTGIVDAFKGSSGAVSGLPPAIAQSVAAGRNLSGITASFRGIGNAVAVTSLKVLGLAALISGPALLAGHSLLTNYKKMANDGLISPEVAASAERVSAAVKKMKEAVSVAWTQIGILTLPIIEKLAIQTTRLADVLGEFIDQNKSLVGTIISSAAKIAGMAAAAAALAKGFAIAMPYLMMTVSPLGLIAIGIGAILFLVPKIRGQFTAVFQWLMEGFQELSKIVGQTVSGMADAISGGSIQIAAKVMWAGLNLAWLTGTSSLKSLWNETVSNMAKDLINGLALMESAWVEWGRFLADAVVVSTMNFRTMWQDAIDAIAMAIASPENREALLELQKAERQKWNKEKVDPMLQGITDAEKLGRQKLDEIEGRRKGAFKESDAIDAEKAKAGQREILKAQEELNAARKEAAGIARQRRTFPSLGKEESTETLSSFSISGVGRTNVGGISDIKKPLINIDENTQKIVDNMNKNPFKFVA